MTYSRAAVAPTGEVTYALQVSSSDLSEALGFEPSRTATVAEIRAGEHRLLQYFLDRVHIEADGKPCPIERRGVDNVEDTEIKAELRFAGRCPADARTMAIDYQIFFDLDPQHMGILELAHAGKTTRAEFTGERRRVQLDLAAKPAPLPDRSASRFLGVERAIFVILLLAIAAVAGKTWLLPRVRG